MIKKAKIEKRQDAIKVQIEEIHNCLILSFFYENQDSKISQYHQIFVDVSFTLATICQKNKKQIIG